MAKLGRTGITAITVGLLATGVGYWAGDKANSPETEPLASIGCGDSPAITLDGAHNPMARMIEYTQGEGESAKAVKGLVLLALDQGGVRVDSTPKMTSGQATRPLDTALSQSATILPDKRNEDQWYVGVPDTIVPFMSGDAAKKGQLTVQVDLSGNAPDTLDAALRVECQGNVS
jgi:hypothetical protein